MFFKYLMFCLLFCLPLCANSNYDKVYIDEEEMKSTQDAFYIHMGHNVWVHTNTVHRDETGVYTYQMCIAKSVKGAKYVYEKKWRCPYCYYYWPVGTRCENSACPSKYVVLLD